jgi:hypothetical protein
MTSCAYLGPILVGSVLRCLTSRDCSIVGRDSLIVYQCLPSTSSAQTIKTTPQRMMSYIGRVFFYLPPSGSFPAELLETGLDKLAHARV